MLLSKPNMPHCLQEGDGLVWVQRCMQDCSLLIGSSLGLVVHFPTSDQMLRPQVSCKGLPAHQLASRR